MRAETPRNRKLAVSHWPVGWRGIRLAEAGFWMSGGTPSTSNDEYWGGRIPWISAASLKSFVIDRSDRMVTDLGAVSGTRVVPKGAVVFVVRGMSLNKEFRVGVTACPVAFGQDCKAISAAEGIDAEFLAHAMNARASDILRMVETTSHGTGRLDTERLGKLEIGVPPMREQRQIVAAVSSLDQDIRALECCIAKQRVMREAVVLKSIAACRRTHRLGDSLLGIDSGWSPACDADPPGLGEWGVIRVSAVTSGVFAPNESKRLPSQLAPRPDLEIRKGDLLLSRANGARALVGVACLVADAPERLMISDKVLRIKPDQEKVIPGYLELILRTPDVRRQIEEMLNGSSGQNNISQASVRELNIPLLDLQDQRRVVASVMAVNRCAELWERRITKLRTLRQALADDLLMGRVRVSDL